MRGLDLIARGSYEGLKVRLSEDSHSMPVRDKLLRFAVLRALLVACESPDILIAYDQDRRLLRHAGGNVAADTRSEVRGFVPRAF